MVRAQRRTKGRARTSAEPAEIGKFAALADDWWNPDGAFKALHRLNPLRLKFIHDECTAHFRRDTRALAPFEGLSLLDIGCGGGLLTEPLARQGFAAQGIDAAPEAVEAAAAHARAVGAPAVYRASTAEDLAAQGESFDVVIAMEVIEHVADRALFLQSAASLLKPSGLMFLATINRTLKALALAKLGAEYVLGWIRPGTHDWNKFVSPETLADELARCEVITIRFQGVSFDPFAWEWRSSSDTGVNYMLAARKN